MPDRCKNGARPPFLQRSCTVLAPFWYRSCTVLAPFLRRSYTVFAPLLRRSCTVLTYIFCSWHTIDAIQSMSCNLCYAIRLPSSVFRTRVIEKFTPCNDRWSRLILDTMGRGRLCVACSYRWCRLILDTMGRGINNAPIAYYDRQRLSSPLLVRNTGGEF